MSLWSNPARFMARVRRGVARRLSAAWRPFHVALHFRLVKGQRVRRARPDEFFVVCLVRNGAYFAREFIGYHTDLGARQIIFIDNGSTDDTVAICAGFDNVLILHCSLRANQYESDLRRYAATHYVPRGSWCLFADMDEQIDRPFRSLLSMGDLLRYLNLHKYTAVAAHMIDMYPGRGEALDAPGRFSRHHRYCELSTVRRVPYFGIDNPHLMFIGRNSLAVPEMVFAHGGVRGRLFGTENWLTKHPLVRIVPGVLPSTHPACSDGVRCADFTMLIRHYKFAGDFAGRVDREVRERTWDHGETEAYQRKITQDPHVEFYGPMSIEYTSVEALADQSLIHVPPRLQDYAAKLSGIPRC
jgi:Glycosyl transferase family 2